MSEKTWKETKAILDDPYVSADTKQMVLTAYSQVGDGNDEALAYFEKYDVVPGFPGGYHQFIAPDAVYEAAKRESEDAGYADRQVQDRLGENQSELDSARAPGAGSGGVTNSDELFDLAKNALRVFEQFIPVDEGSPAECKHVDSPLSIEDVRKRFDEQRGIDFQKFFEEAQRLREAHSVLDELHGTTESNLNSLYKDWTGAGANASYQKYSEEIAPNTQELLEYLEGGAEVIETAVQTVFEACKHKADEVIALYTPTVGSATPDTATKVMKLARGEIESKEQILEVAAWVDAETGSSIEPTIRADGGCDLNDENKTYTAAQCRKWVRESWNPDLYDNLHHRFTQICDDTKEAVDTAWEELNTYFRDYSSEFPAGSGDTSIPPPTGQPQPNTPGVGGGPGPGAGAGVPGAGGGPSGGGGTPSVPEIGMPEDGKNPITGDALEINPETGEPYPIDPETGDAVKEVGDDQRTLTVEKGDRTFEMTEPDDGRMNISVDDGSGQVKDYALDFGDVEQADGEPEEFGPRGSEDGDESVYRPGPDGKIHIDEGNLTIIAEQPEGPDGPTTVTVDDGTPPPTTYTLGEVKEDDAAGAGLGVSRDQIRTMPAPAPDGPPVASGGGSGSAGESGDSAGGGNVPDGGAAGTGGGTGGERGLGEPGAGGGTDPQTASMGGGGSLGGGGEGGERLQAGGQSGVTDSVSSGAGLGSTPGGTAEQPVTSATQGSVNGAGGTGMMGGMGAMGGAAGGQGGGDQERSSNPYRIDGAIFETEGGASRISGSLLGDDDSPVRFDR